MSKCINCKDNSCSKCKVVQIEKSRMRTIEPLSWNYNNLRIQSQYNGKKGAITFTITTEHPSHHDGEMVGEMWVEVEYKNSPRKESLFQVGCRNFGTKWKQLREAILYSVEDLKQIAQEIAERFDTFGNVL